MADFISREKAIETIRYRVCQGHGNKEHICKRGSCAYCGIMEIMEDISSIEAADVQPVERWISCKDKMPEEYKTVLVYEKDYGVMIGELEKKFFDTQYFIARKSGLILRTTEVTHWQPLPEAPETKKR